MPVYFLAMVMVYIVTAELARKIFYERVRD
jgi:hypothetical protein